MKKTIEFIQSIIYYIGIFIIISSVLFCLIKLFDGNMINKFLCFSTFYTVYRYIKEKINK